ncbi:MAG: tetratricopeptide repeat protein, partial [Gemmataceae bacterium]
VELLAEAVNQAHKQGLLHRGLNPHNVFFAAATTVLPAGADAPSIPKAAGFDDPPAGREEPGVASYLAPEQATGRAGAGNALVDVYALGAILYAALTGKPPFSASTVADTLEKIRTEPVSPPSSWRADLPEDLQLVCLRCLDKDPNKRYPNAQELANDLRLFLADKPVSARPLSRWDTARKWIEKNPTEAALSAFGVFVVLLLIVFSQWIRTGSALKDAQKEVQVDTAELSKLKAQNATLETAVKAQTEWLEAASGDADLGPRLALLHLAANDLPAYRQLCAGLLRKLGRNADPETTYAVVWTSVLGPQAIPDPGRLDELTEQLLERHPQHPPRFLVLRGAALYRAGRYGKAITELDQALAAGPKPPVFTWLFLAMAHQKQGNSDQAKEWLERAANWEQATKQPAAAGMPSRWDELPWTEKLTYQLLRQEAEGLRE